MRLLLFLMVVAAGIAAASVSYAKSAVIRTTLGNITVELFPKQAPVTVENFVGLATGKKDWTDPRNKKTIKHKPLYNGTVFHRVIPGFMIQGGDPLANGSGGPGYRFNSEFDASLVFDKPGILAMANAGPGTNGCQFFITVAPTPQLNGRYTIFGRVTKGQDVVDTIAKLPKKAADRPVHPPVIKSIEIHD